MTICFLKSLRPDAASDKPIRSVDVGGYHVAVYGVLRPMGLPQDANLHQTKVSAIYYIPEGTARLVTGGTMPNAKPMAPGRTNLQSPRIEGGESRRVSKGDVVIIPGLTPDWWSSQEGDLKYLIFRLRKKYVLATLSNGNVSLLVEMAKKAGLPWDTVLSAELFHHYKPDREVYLGAADLLGCLPAQVMMVAAHPDDLKAAASCGLRTALRPSPDGVRIGEGCAGRRTVRRDGGRFSGFGREVVDVSLTCAALHPG